MFTPEVMKKLMLNQEVMEKQLAHAAQRYGPQSRVVKMWREQLHILSKSLKKVS
jgi:hypothetical protein